jgi:hypothetical protein
MSASHPIIALDSAQVPEKGNDTSSVTVSGFVQHQAPSPTDSTASTVGYSPDIVADGSDDIVFTITALSVELLMPKRMQRRDRDLAPRHVATRARKHKLAVPAQ